MDPLGTPSNAITISWSEIDAWRQCPLKWRLAYAERWVEPLVSPALSKGLLWHKVLEIHYLALQSTGRLSEAIEESLAGLKERESKILRLYFGLDGEDPMTLEDIGTLLGITRERVRQIKEKALLKLRHNSRRRALESFLG